MGQKDYNNGFKFTLLPHRLSAPMDKKKPTLFFVNSMSDLFHEDMPDEYIDKVMDTIRFTPQHKYQILTKRSERLLEYFQHRQIPANTMLGATVENIIHGLPRIEHVRQLTSAPIRFLSIEPLLEDIGTLNLKNIDWVIVGGESGPKARPMKQEWVTSIRDQCLSQDVSFYFKQWGTWGADMVKRSKKKNGRLLEGRKWVQMPA